MPLIETIGSASAKALGLNSASQQLNYIEDVFSTYLYTGNASTQNIVNGIDLAGKGGMVWGKTRNDTTRHVLFDTERGVLNEISSNLTAAQTNHAASLTAFNSNGYTLGNDDWTNYSTTFNSVSWTFRKQPKFFDVVTYTGTGSSLTVNHNLGSTPGCIIIKNYNPGNTDWTVYHRSLGTGAYLQLNNTNASVGSTAVSAVSSTTFTVAGGSANWNSSGQSYVAYLFAHDAGGFGTAGTDNVISCGSYTAGSENTITLGYEPQWVLLKKSSAVGDWHIYDNMRGMSVEPFTSGNGDWVLKPNTSGAETQVNQVNPTPTGFIESGYSGSGQTIIYIAIRRGPMKTPTTGASVFEPAFATANSPEYKSNTVISGFDSAINIYRPGYSDANFSYPYLATRLQGAGKILFTSNTNTEYTYSTAATFAWNTGWFNSTFGADTNRESYMFKRAPGFHDVVCYTSDGNQPRTLSHNLGVTPELIIVKTRSYAAQQWPVYSAALGNTKVIYLNLANAPATTSLIWNNTSPTATTFTVGSTNSVNALNSGETYIALLFASCPGVSKVGSYTGTGANQTIDCGFASGVRWVLIKRTDTTGDWYVYDTTRGMTSGTDPYILLNSVAAEVTGTNYVETIATGFRLIGSNAGTNANGGTYIYLAIA